MKRKVDPRGLRFAASVTAAVLVAVLITSSVWLLAAQAVVFGLGAVLGVRYAPYGLVYRFLIRPRLGPPRELEDEAPPRFAQGVGLVFALAGVVGYTVGVVPLGIAATALALMAAFLNAAFGLCLGCEMYVMMRRVWPAHHTARA
jgi:FtsH-binding integral membrane protein